MAPQRPPIDQLLDLFVFVPLAVAGAVRDDLAALSANGRREVDTARMFGKFAVDLGRRKVEERLNGLIAGPTTPATDGAETPPVDPARSAAEAAPSAPAATRRRPSSSPSAAASLPIADYDSLAASQVIARLAALEPEELGAVRAYETANRGRRTILGKLDQLESGG